MAYREHYDTKLLPGNFYHIYNRSIKEIPLFITDANRLHFLKLLNFHLGKSIHVYAYCLMDNHFHFLVEVLELDKGEEATHQLVHDGFRKCFQAYALAINGQEGRYGSLFQKPFKRAWVDSPEYFTQLVFYIHANPQHHRVCADFRDYRWSSYQAMLSKGKTLVMREAVLEWFGGRDGFLNYHLEGKMELDERLLIERI